MSMVRSNRLLTNLVIALICVLTGIDGALKAQENSVANFPEIPDIEVKDQHGRSHRFYSDLVKGKTVAINFLFTGCSTVCPQLGASSAQLARVLAEKPDDRLHVISISFDPGADTPERLAEWSANFDAAPGWTLVTGRRRDIDTLLRALQVYTADKDLHSSNFLLGNAAAAEWRRVPGTTAPAKLAETMRQLAGDPPSVAAPAIGAKAETAAARYFPDLPLLNHRGETRRFYSDLVKGRVIVMQTIFADCGGVCPVMVERFAKVQAQLGERVGRDVFMLSITVDPVSDTPEKLRAYAERVGAKSGWEFLTGDKANIDAVLKKLGQYVEARDAHSSIVIIGNEPSGLWKKALGVAAPDEITRIVLSVADDRG